MVSERQLAGERKNERRTARQVRRTPAVVLGLVVVLTLGVGVTAAIDLRRLDTPEGAAQAWVQATLIGDCNRYLLLSVAATTEPEDGRTTAGLCQDLLESSRAGLQDAVRTRVQVTGDIVREGSVARVVVKLQREGTTAVSRRLLLSRQERWRVVRDAEACGLVSCP